MSLFYLYNIQKKHYSPCFDFINKQFYNTISIELKDPSPQNADQCCIDQQSINLICSFPHKDSHNQNMHMHMFYTPCSLFIDTQILFNYAAYLKFHDI